MRQLLEREAVADPGLLTGGAEPAAAVLTRRAATRAPTRAVRALHGLLWLVANLAARDPLLVLADDVHWADTASLRWLVFLAERVEDLGALLIVATRPGRARRRSGAARRAMTAPAARVLRPAPLSASATTTVVRGRMPHAVEHFRPPAIARPAAIRSCSASC